MQFELNSVKLVKDIKRYSSKFKLTGAIQTLGYQMSDFTAISWM